jgi:D-alanyl-D-alanine carboxypeptidase/D-alanyl-D-alanine-endopeptidase (penicillin-binding protein 4)
VKARKSGWIQLGLATLLNFHIYGQEQKAPASAVELQQRLAQLIEQPKYAGAIWGVKVVSLDTGKTLFEHNPQKLFSPASNSKLYTVALALDRLGPDFKIRTSLYSNSKPSNDGVLYDNLIVYGRGDPSINARLHGDVFKALEPLVSALTNSGVQRVDGDIVGDATFIRGPEFGSGWSWDDPESSYGAEISALTINDNILSVSIQPGDDIGTPARLLLSPGTDYLLVSNKVQTIEKAPRRGVSLFRPLEENLVYVSGQVSIGDTGLVEEVTVHEPAGLFIALFKEALNRHGIKVTGKLRTRSWLEPSTTDCSSLVELGSIESLPLSVIAGEVLKPSQNLYADLLLAQVGERTRLGTTPASETSEDLGIAELKKLLAQAGVSDGDVFFEEGSGLSRDNLTTPNATTALLQYMSHHRCGEVYKNSLPVAGVDGTLRNRMKGTVAAGNVRAKTGTLRWANSLAGYVTSAAGERLAFCIMLNRYHSTGQGTPARADIDAMAVALAGFTVKSAN